MTADFGSNTLQVPGQGTRPALILPELRVGRDVHDLRLCWRTFHVSGGSRQSQSQEHPRAQSPIDLGSTLYSCAHGEGLAWISVETLLGQGTWTDECHSAVRNRYQRPVLVITIIIQHIGPTDDGLRVEVGPTLQKAHEGEQHYLERWPRVARGLDSDLMIIVLNLLHILALASLPKVHMSQAAASNKPNESIGAFVIHHYSEAHQRSHFPLAPHKPQVQRQTSTNHGNSRIMQASKCEAVRLTYTSRVNESRRSSHAMNPYLINISRVNTPC